MRLQTLFSDPAGFFLDLLLILPALLIALSFHEFAHAFAANAMGDATPRSMGRLTLAPFAHVDPIGFFMFAFLGFGYGKPVPVNPNNFKNRFWGEIFVSLAGVIMNFLLAALFTAGYMLLIRFDVTNAIVLDIVVNIIGLNIALMIFNLLPLPPLDGYRVVKRLFIGNIRPQFFWNIERYGFILILVLVMSGFINPILTSASNGIVNFLFRTFLFLA